MKTIWAFIFLTSICLMEMTRSNYEISLCNAHLYNENIPINCDCSPLRTIAHCTLDNSKKIAWHLLETIMEITFLSIRIERFQDTKRKTEFKTVPTKYINKFPKLKEFQFIQSNIKILPRHAFVNYRFITEIYITKNNIETVYEEAVGNMSSLERLYMDYNGIQSVHVKAFYNMPFIVTLNLGYNKLNRLSDFQFESLPSLRILILKRNNLRKLSQLHFAGLKKANHLNLSFNKLHTLKNNTFRRLLNLRTLNLSDNLLKKLEPAAFRGMLQLWTLNLAGNLLVQLGNLKFSYLPRLTRLDLRRNRLTTLGYEVMAPIYNNFVYSESTLMRQLQLHGNNMACDCSLAWIYALAKNMVDQDYSNAIGKKETHCYFKVSCPKTLNCPLPYDGIVSNKTYSDEYYLDLAKKNRSTRTVGILPKDHVYYKLAYVNLLEIPVEALGCSNAKKIIGNTIVIFIFIVKLFLFTFNF